MSTFGVMSFLENEPSVDLDSALSARVARSPSSICSNVIRRSGKGVPRSCPHDRGVAAAIAHEEPHP